MNRYHRQEILKEIGPEGQKKLGLKSIAIVGCGGLGSIAAPYLAGAGIGSILLIDGDKIDESNLHRQVMYAGKVGKSKSIVLAEHLKMLNPLVNIDCFSEYINNDNVAHLLCRVDIILDCTDQLETKLILNHYTKNSKKPLIYAAVHQFEGYASTFLQSNEQDACLINVYPDADAVLPTCSQEGILGTTVAIFGLIQATECIKLITGCAPTLHNKLLWMDTLNYTQRIIDLV